MTLPKIPRGQDKKKIVLRQFHAEIKKQEASSISIYKKKWGVERN